MATHLHETGKTDLKRKYIKIVKYLKEDVPQRHRGCSVIISFYLFGVLKVDTDLYFLT